MDVGENTRSSTDSTIRCRSTRFNFTKIRESTPQTNVAVFAPKGRPGVADDPVANALAVLVVRINNGFFTVTNQVNTVVNAPNIIFAVGEVVLQNSRFVPLPVAGGDADGLGANHGEASNGGGAVVGFDGVVAVGTDLHEVSEPVVRLLIGELRGDVVASSSFGITSSREEKIFVRITPFFSDKGTGFVDVSEGIAGISTVTAVAGRWSARVDLCGGDY